MRSWLQDLWALPILLPLVLAKLTANTKTLPFLLFFGGQFVQRSMPGTLVWMPRREKSSWSYRPRTGFARLLKFKAVTNRPILSPAHAGHPWQMPRQFVELHSLRLVATEAVQCLLQLGALGGFARTGGQGQSLAVDRWATICLVLEAQKWGTPNQPTCECLLHQFK